MFKSEAALFRRGLLEAEAKQADEAIRRLESTSMQRIAAPLQNKRVSDSDRGEYEAAKQRHARIQAELDDPSLQLGLRNVIFGAGDSVAEQIAAFAVAGESPKSIAGASEGRSGPIASRLGSRGREG
jgi:hypothetical protein